MNIKCTYFDGNTITVSVGTHRPEDLINAITYTLEAYYGDYHLHDDVRSQASRLARSGDDYLYELEQLLEELTEELEALAEMHGYYFGTTEGDGAHYVLSPVVGPEGL